MTDDVTPAEAGVQRIGETLACAGCAGARLDASGRPYILQAPLARAWLTAHPDASGRPYQTTNFRVNSTFSQPSCGMTWTGKSFTHNET